MNNRICEAGVTAAPAYNKATTCGTEPTQLATVTIPAYQGADGVNDPFKPTLGAWRNTIVYYAKNGAVYLYDVNGVYTNLTGTDWGTQIANAMEQINALNTSLNNLSTQLAGDVSKLEQADSDLSEQIELLRTNTNAQLTTLTNGLSNATSAAENASSIANQANQAVTTEATAREAAVSALTASLAEETSARKSADTSLQGLITTNTESIASLQQALEGEAAPLAKSVVYDLATDTDVSTVNLNLTVGVLNESTTSQQSVALPVAAPNQAGVMNASMYETFQGLSAAVEAIQGGTVEISDLPADASQDDLTEAWKTASGKADLVNQAKIYDSSNNKIWTYYANTQTWAGEAAGSESVSVSQATNSSLGIVQGSTSEGKVAVEGDGTMSLNGWDAQVSATTTNTNAIANLQSSIGTIATTLARLNNGAGVVLES